MSNLPVETTESEPDPVANSIANDQTVNKEGVDAAAPTTENGSAEDVKKSEEKTEPKPENKDDEKTKENGASSDRKYSNNKYDKQKAQRYNKFRNESKYDASVLPETDDPSLIRAQVEFYFGDANLPTDKHMWKLTDGPVNKPVAISDITAFGRMKRFQPYSAVVAALRDSALLEVIGPEGLEEVRRKKPYDPNARAGSRSESRSIYAKGFGDEEPTTQFDIEAFFAPYGPINVVRLRRTQDKLFKGSVFVEFADDDLAQKFLELDPKPKWQDKYDLKITSKREYTAGKEQEIKDGLLEPSETRPRPFNGNNQLRGRGRGNFRGGDRKGDRDPDDWKKRREDDQKSGFKDRRGDRNSRGRGGRGRGGRDREDRGPRNNDRNREREEKEKNGEKNGDKPESEKAEAKTQVETENNEKKRPRDDEGAEGAPAAKKVDTKPEVTAEAS